MSYQEEQLGTMLEEGNNEDSARLKEKNEKVEEASEKFSDYVIDDAVYIDGRRPKSMMKTWVVAAEEYLVRVSTAIVMSSESEEEQPAKLIINEEDGEVRGRGFIGYTKRIDMPWRIYDNTIATYEEPQQRPAKLCICDAERYCEDAISLTTSD
ncbi:unnamed protein product [Ceratitis capitata]|uniref:(Mediterranean fruit fly) hypothetical protein n=1 Tax=Ceratitis capitata TaxID=7213 RepID=A0A811UQY9_CERCA|nr:unnamed protein product [Ceratitis capitata]